jgi:hypothetical protein
MHSTQIIKTNPMKNEYLVQKEVFRYACDHFPTVIHTLTGIEKLNQPTLGLEGWFRIELAKAIEKTNILQRISNRGVDLILKDGQFLELKAGADMNFKYILNGADEYPCLFLGKPRGKYSAYDKNMLTIEFKNKSLFQIKIEMERLQNNWYIGLINKI